MSLLYPPLFLSHGAHPEIRSPQSLDDQPARPGKDSVHSLHARYLPPMVPGPFDLSWRYNLPRLADKSAVGTINRPLRWVCIQASAETLCTHQATHLLLLL